MKYEIVADHVHSTTEWSLRVDRVTIVNKKETREVCAFFRAKEKELLQEIVAFLNGEVE